MIVACPLLDSALVLSTPACSLGLSFLGQGLLFICFRTRRTCLLHMAACLCYKSAHMKMLDLNSFRPRGRCKSLGLMQQLPKAKHRVLFHTRFWTGVARCWLGFVLLLLWDFWVTCASMLLPFLWARYTVYGRGTLTVLRCYSALLFMPGVCLGEAAKPFRG